MLDCAHIAPPDGVCQHQGCANKMCEGCVAACDTCHNTLCPTHQHRLSCGTVVCPDHVLSTVGLKLVNRARHGRGDRTEENTGLFAGIAALVNKLRGNP
ncbi:MAG: hypothetical protein SV186_04860 [Candidatus Nanohaloarchaea archaeon]|nr:hypothetical protein [Candidatus Nanohaloarchaea archaeon]